MTHAKLGAPPLRQVHHRSMIGKFFLLHGSLVHCFTSDLCCQIVEPPLPAYSIVAARPCPRPGTRGRDRNRSPSLNLGLTAGETRQPASPLDRAMIPAIPASRLRRQQGLIPPSR